MGVTFLPPPTLAADGYCWIPILTMDGLGVCFSTDKIVNDVPKMTSSASQPDLLGGWDSWAAGTSAGMNSTASKPAYTNTGRWRNIMLGFITKCLKCTV